MSDVPIQSYQVQVLDDVRQLQVRATVLVTGTSGPVLVLVELATNVEEGSDGFPQPRRALVLVLVLVLVPVLVFPSKHLHSICPLHTPVRFEVRIPIVLIVKGGVKLV